jgi:hypothetical protein
VILSGVVGVITWLGNFTGALQNISSFWGQSENSKTAQMPIARLPFDIQMQTAKARIRYLSQEYLHTDTLSLVEIIGHYGDNQLDSPELYDWDKVMMELEKQEFIKILKKENGNIVFKVVKTK